MKQTFIIFLFVIQVASLLAQTSSKKIYSFKQCPSVALLKSTSKSDLLKPSWHTVMRSLHNKPQVGDFAIAELKHAANKSKKNTVANLYDDVSKKKRGATPLIKKNFEGNMLRTWTPTDNTIAISNNGYIVSCINYGIEYYDTSGTKLLADHTWDAFVNDSTLNQAKFDPRVIYDRKNDRFVLVFLHGFSSATSKILTCFSKTNNPMDGWNIYQLSGNPFSDTSWTDYPTIGLNDFDLFISVNQFGDAPTYSYKGSYIYQVGLQQGYNAQPLVVGTWDSLIAPDGTPGITVCPAPHGLGQSMLDTMHFVYLRPDSGSKVYTFQIVGDVSSSSKTLTASQFPIPYYQVCADGYIKSHAVGSKDSIGTGSAWVQNCYYQNKTLHFTGSKDMGTGWCGIQYGRVYLDSNKAVTRSYGVADANIAYPAVASFGYNATDHSAAIAYLKSSETINPETGVIAIDNALQWSAAQIVKKADTVVDIITPPYNFAERWGDYTGICRKYNQAKPTVWMAGAFAANTPPRSASYSTWVAEVVTQDDSSMSVGITEQPLELKRVSLYPNPATDMVNVTFFNNEVGVVSIAIYDLQGRLIKLLFKDLLSSSYNTLSFNKLMLSSGSYFIKATHENAKTIFVEKISIQ